MAEIINRKKPLSVSPLKTSQTIGAAFAFLGLRKAMPLMHGSQGCTAFAKVFFVRHFREPIPLQTTAMDQVSSVMGADGNITEALKNIAEKNNPAIIGLVTTGLAETQGCDIRRAVYDFRQKYPQFAEVEVVAVNTPDFSGSFESGFAVAVKGILRTLVPEARGEASRVGSRQKQVNVLCGANLTPSDLEFVEESIASFGLRPLLIPDVSASLDGHLDDTPHNPLTSGGASIADVKTAHESIATLAVGESLFPVAKFLTEHCEVPHYNFGYLMDIDTVDAWLMCLARLSGQPVPAKWARQRRQLQDAMLDTHFMIGDARVALAADPDLVLALARLTGDMGATPSAIVVPAKSDALKGAPLAEIQVGDLEDLEQAARACGCDLVLGNSHAVASAMRLEVPILRVGFPQYDLIGGYQRQWFGYRGIQQVLFDMANLLVAHHRGIAPYRSIYKSQEITQQDSQMDLHLDSQMTQARHRDVEQAKIQ